MTKSTLVVGQKIGSQNPFKIITSTMVASCFGMTLLLIAWNILKVQKPCSRISSDTLYSSPLSIKAPILIKLIICFFFFCCCCYFLFVCFVLLLLFFLYFYLSSFVFPFPTFLSVSASLNKLNKNQLIIGWSLQVSLCY